MNFQHNHSTSNDMDISYFDILYSSRYNNNFLQHETRNCFEFTQTNSMPFIPFAQTNCSTEEVHGSLPNLNACSVDNMIRSIESSPAVKTLQYSTLSKGGDNNTKFQPKSRKRLCLEKNDIQASNGRKVESYSCPVCQKSFSFYGTFSSHLRTHLKERPFTCNICRRKFVDRSTLIKHKRVHTGEKPYTCPICGQKFAQSGDMLRHKRKIHD